MFKNFKNFKSFINFKNSKISKISKTSKISKEAKKTASGDLWEQKTYCPIATLYSLASKNTKILTDAKMS